MNGEPRTTVVRNAPLSFQQQETLRNMRRTPGSEIAYDSLLVLRLHGELDEGLLDEALVSTVNRHPALRTTIAPSPSGPVQRVHPDVDPAAVNRRAQSGSVKDMVDQIVGERYGLAEVLGGRPLFRAGLHRVGDDVHLNFAIHHMIFDGWSTDLLLRDVSEFYAARSERREPLLPPVGLTYADFADQQREVWERKGAEAVEFWGRWLGDSTGEVAWPQPGNAGGIAPDTGGIVEAPLSPRAVSAVRAISKSERVTPFIVLLAATATSIARTTGTTDIFLGTDTANRENSDSRQTIGYFTNTQFSCLRATPDRTMGDLVQEVRHVLRESAKYGDVYSGQLLEALRRSQPVKVNLSPAPVRAGRALVLPDVRAERVPVHTLMRYWRDFTMQWYQDGAVNSGAIWYRHAGIDLAAVDRIAADVDEILAGTHR